MATLPNFDRSAGVVDLRGSTTGLEGIAEIIGRKIATLHPDNPLRKIFAPETADQERQRTLQEEIDRQLPVQKQAQVITQPARRAVAQEAAIPLEQEAADLATAAAREREDNERALATSRALRQILPATEAAGIAAQLERTKGVEAERGERAAERDIELFDAMDRLGFTAESQIQNDLNIMAHEALVREAEARGIAVTEDARDRLVRIMNDPTADDTMRLVITAGIANNSPLAQYLLQNSRFDQEKTLLNLRNAENAVDRRVEMAKTLMQFQDQRNQLLTQLEQAIEDGESAEIEVLANDIRSLQEVMKDLDPTMLTLDPTLRTGLGDKVKNVAFDVGAPPSLADHIETAAIRLASSSDETKALQDFKTVTSLLFPNAVERAAFEESVQTRARQIRAGDRDNSITSALVQLEDPALDRLTANIDAEIAALEAEVEAMTLGGTGTSGQSLANTMQVLGRKRMLRAMSRGFLAFAQFGAIPQPTQNRESNGNERR